MPPVPATTIIPARRVQGTLRVPGDKSISHRYALIAAVAEGASRLANYAPGADCQSTLACLGRLGVDIQRGEQGAVTVVGRGLRGWSSPSGPLDAGNSGSTMRMLAGLLAAQPFSAQMIGDASLSRRPMRRVIEPLSRMGARIEATDGHAPLTIHGASLHAITHRPDVPSAQVKSAVLLAGLYAEGKTSVTEPAQTRDHTERALAAFGLDVSATGNTITVAGGQERHRATPGGPGRFFLRGILDGRGGRSTRIARRDPRCRAQSHANGPHRRAAPLRRACRGARDRIRGGRSSRHDRGDGRSHRQPSRSRQKRSLG